MRWEILFADLESQLEARAAEDLREEIAESTRVERARQTLDDWLLGCRGRHLTLRVGGGHELCGTLGPVGSDYLCLEDPARTWLVRRAAIQTISVPDQHGDKAATLARSRWGQVLRALLRDRQQVEVHDLSGASLGEGTLRQAAEDFLVLAIHPRDEYARPRTVQGHVVIPYQGVGWLAIAARE